MGNVQASTQKSPESSSFNKNSPHLDGYGPPLTPSPPSASGGVIEGIPAPVDIDKDSENPGSVEELHRKCKELFPKPFDGINVTTNLGISNHLQASHNLNITNGKSAGYKFGVAYVGDPISPTEAYPILQGDIDFSGCLNSSIVCSPFKNTIARFQAQSENAKFQFTNYVLEYRGRDYTASFMLANPSLSTYNGVAVGHYLQSVTKKFAAGAELIYQRMPAQFGGQSAITSLVGKYTGSDFVASASIGMGGIQVSYYQKCSDQLSIGVELENTMRTDGTQASLGYQINVPQAELNFKGSIDTTWNIHGVLEKRLLPSPFVLGLSASLNHRTDELKTGISIVLG